MSQTIEEIQEEIISDFEILGGDMESTIFYIMELGQKLSPLSEDHQIDDNLIKGCQSKVWLTSEFNDGKVVFKADSNTELTKGLISMLVRVYSNQTPEDILKYDPYFIEKIGMQRVIGSQRSNGLASMIKQMKMYALAYQTKETQS